MAEQDLICHLWSVSPTVTCSLDCGPQFSTDDSQSTKRFYIDKFIVSNPNLADKYEYCPCSDDPLVFTDYPLVLMDYPLVLMDALVLQHHRDTEVISEKISANLMWEIFPPIFLYYLSLYNHYGSSSHVGFSNAEAQSNLFILLGSSKGHQVHCQSLISNYTLEYLAHLRLIF